MRIAVVVASLIGLTMAGSAPSAAGIQDGLQDPAKIKLVAQATTTAREDDSPTKPKEKVVKPKEIVEKPKEKPVTPEGIRSCTALGLDWITPWKPKLLTLRNLPAWADYVLTISEKGEVLAADLLDASAKGIFKLGRSNKVVKVLLAQKITPTGSIIKCHETLYFYKNTKGRSTKMPESRCSQSPEFCVKS